MKEKLPSLLASKPQRKILYLEYNRNQKHHLKPGLEVACSLFNILDAKDRKIVVKSI